MSQITLHAQYDDGLWTVVDTGSRRWWTSTGSNDQAHIVNEKLAPVQASSALGRKIRAAVAAEERKESP